MTQVLLIRLSLIFQSKMRNFFQIFLLFQLLFSLSLQAEQWSNADLQQLKQFSFKNIPLHSRDPSNGVLNNPNAIKLGELLFNDVRLSKNKKIACTSCHIKALAFTDNRKVAQGMRLGSRNTPSLLNTAEQNWFFWDGRKDSLWAQVLDSIENPAEHGFTRVEMLHFISNNQAYRKQYQQIFSQQSHLLPTQATLKEYPKKAGPESDIDHLIAWKKLSKEQKHSVNRVFTNIGKVIAAFVSTIKNKPSRFDRFIDEVSKKGESSVLNQSEQNGLKIFMSQDTGCTNCHRGGLLSNGEFHNIGTGIRGRDNGRSEVVDAVIRDKFNCLGKFSDAKPEECLELKYANNYKHVLAGAYKTPSLRNLSKTAPYMHDGRFSNLKDVVDYYASIDKEKAKEIDLPPIKKMSDAEKADLVNFLLTL